MKYRRLFLGGMSIVLIILISACDSKKTTTKQEQNVEETSVIYKGDYAALLPFQTSSARIKHSQLSTGVEETMTLGQGLMQLSKEYFDPEKYTYKDSVFLDYSSLDARSDGDGLLGRTSETNPNGLNPAVGTEFKLTNKKTKKISSSDVVLHDIYELDWYKGNELSGISLALVLNSEIGEDSDSLDTISDDMLRTYGEDVGRKLVSYLRKAKPEIGQKTPILVTLYKKGAVNSPLSGTFISKGYFASKTVGEFSSITQQRVLLPSDEATALDGTTASNFSNFLGTYEDLLPDKASTIATALYENKQLVSLKIEVVMYAKTWGEANAAIQTMHSSLKTYFSSKTYGVQLIVKNNDELAAIITRSQGSSELNSNVLY